MGSDGTYDDTSSASQVITEFGNYAGVPREMRQSLIRLAKTNGNTLGFLS